ncbi:hypothetical protein WMY93_005108 [Mugilogobius chulae]|uniref:Vacuolar protein sorting-associated protein 33A n=1 Tax=Mugilogobius chulae TaxID=88201 RepID=A0AAW0PRJ7_9GOBI
MAAHLSYGRVNLNILREAARKELREFLDKCAGSKAIVWDEYLTGPFGLIAQYSLLKEHEVEKMFTLKRGRLPSADVKNIIFFVRPRLELMEIIADNVFGEDKLHSSRDFHILFVPRRSMLCEQRLKELGVLGSFINIDEYILDLIPYDGDLLSMEYESAFRECYLENDQTSLYHTAKGLMTLQALYGTIPQIYGKGECARHVANMMLRMKREFAGSQNQILPVFDTLLLLDRNVDLLTPLATQLTYEGLIDEIYGINNGYVKLPPEKFAQKKQGEASKDLPTEHKKLQLNSAEELYAEIRDKNFNAVGSALSKKAKIISAAFEERHNAKTVGEIKQFVSQLPHMQAARISLANHTSIAELIKDITTSEAFFDKLTVEQEFMTGVDTDKLNVYIEDRIAQKDPLIKILRLVCMQSVCNNGLKQKVLDFYKREILQTYGYEHILTLNNLEKAGLLKPQTSSRNNYPTIRKTLKLWMEDANEQNPNDISYVYSGYAPLSIRLTQVLARPGWRSIEEVLKMLPGPHFEERQQLPAGLHKKRQQGENRTTLVFFLGGVTYAEIAALRFLSQMEDSGMECFCKLQNLKEELNEQFFSPLQLTKDGSSVAGIIADSKHGKYNVYSTFQSHKPEFDYLKSLEEKINKIRWLPQRNAAHFLLSTNDKTIKLWKIRERDKRLEGYNIKDNEQYKDFTTSLQVPVFKPMDLIVEAILDECLPKLNSISVNSDNETYLSADDLHINLWHLETLHEDNCCPDLSSCGPMERLDYGLDKDRLCACALGDSSACHVDECKTWVVNMSTAAQQNNNEEPGLHGSWVELELNGNTGTQNVQSNLLMPPAADVINANAGLGQVTENNESLVGGLEHVPSSSSIHNGDMEKILLDAQHESSPSNSSCQSPHRPPSPDQDEGQIMFDVEMSSPATCQSEEDAQEKDENIENQLKKKQTGSLIGPVDLKTFPQKTFTSDTPDVRYLSV